MNRIGAMALTMTALASVGCAYAHVQFTDVGGNPPFAKADETYPDDGVERDGVLRICFDCNGDPYPDPRETPIDDTRLTACHHSLREYFGGAYDARAIAEGFGRRLNRACAGKTLVILIHGINTSYPESRRSYHSARLAVQEQFRDRGLVFLELYWDGMCGDPVALWPNAREGSKWTGLRLRPMLREIDRSIPVRVITHSRGAAVICSALWNVRMDEAVEANAAFAEAQKTEPAPEGLDIRLGFVAPAIGEEEFETFGTRASEIDRIVVGVNEDDPALGKGLLPAAWFGSTRLGCSLDAFRAVARELNRVRAIAWLVDLSNAAVHDFKDYVLRKDFLGDFLHGLLDEVTSGSPRPR